MPYDIYGNILQKGHCEVHPDVPEEYPCSRCMERSNPPYEREPEPQEPDPTVAEYICFDAEKFKAAVEEVIAKQEDDTAFVEVVKNLFRNLGLDFGFVHHVISEIEKEGKNADSVDNS